MMVQHSPRSQKLFQVEIQYALAGDNYSITLYVADMHRFQTAAQTPAITDKKGEEAVSALVLNNKGLVLGITRSKNGIFSDGPDLEPSLVSFYENGNIKQREHRQNGLRQDPPDGRPALAFYFEDGRCSEVIHCSKGQFNDPAKQRPAYICFDRNGSIRHAESYKDNISQHIYSSTEKGALFRALYSNKKTENNISPFKLA